MLEKAAGYLLAPFESSETLGASLLGAVTSFTDLQSKTAWLYLFSSAGMGALLYWLAKRRGERQATSLLGFLFPRDVYLHRSAILDYKFVGIDLTIKAVLYSPLVSGVSMLVYKGAESAAGGLAQLGWSPEAILAGTIAIPVITILVADFGFFFAHYLMHRIPVLWFFHQIHHSAEVLTPFTVYRTHPVEDLINGLVAGVLGGVGVSVYAAATDNVIDLPTLLGVNIVQFLFFTFAFQLRHSHIWLSYGPGLSRILISPAQHQVHHSVDPRHWDRNYGFIFAFWDWIFGSLYVPRGREQLVFGLPGSDPRDFSTVPRVYFLPFAKAARWVTQRMRARTLAP